jgi:VanZ family protein
MIIISPLNSFFTAENTSSFIEPILRWLFPLATSETVHSLHILIRKISHFLEYALLTFLWFRAFRGAREEIQWRWIAFAGSISLVYAALDELLQAQIPSRTGAVLDWVIDSAGVLCMLGGIGIIMSLKKTNV